MCLQMPHAAHPPSAHRGGDGNPFKSLAFPLCVFSLSLFLLLFLSWFFVLPLFTSFAVGDGQRISSIAMARRERELGEQVRALEQRRQALSLTIGDPAAVALRAQVARDRSLRDIAERLDATAHTIAGTGGVIVLTGLTVDSEHGVVEVDGDVRNVQLRSLTVLSQFVDALSRAAFLSDLERPSFVRIEDPDIGPHSPFHLSFRLL